MMKQRRFRLPIVPALLAAAIPVQAQIYRCSDGDTIVFSDLPCSNTAEIHETSGRLSVVSADADIASIAQRNQEFIERRLERIDQRRERTAERRALRQRVPEAVRYRNVIGHANSIFPGRFGHGPFRGNRFDRRDNADENGASSGTGRERNPALRAGPAEFSILRR